MQNFKYREYAKTAEELLVDYTNLSITPVGLTKLYKIYDVRNYVCELSILHEMATTAVKTYQEGCGELWVSVSSLDEIFGLGSNRTRAVKAKCAEGMCMPVRELDIENRDSLSLNELKSLTVNLDRLEWIMKNISPTKVTSFNDSDILKELLSHPRNINVAVANDEEDDSSMNEAEINVQVNQIVPASKSIVQKFNIGKVEMEYIVTPSKSVYFKIKDVGKLLDLEERSSVKNFKYQKYAKTAEELLKEYTIMGITPGVLSDRTPGVIPKLWRM